MVIISIIVIFDIVVIIIIIIIFLVIIVIVIIIMVGLVCIRRGANDGDEDKTLAEAHNAPNDDGHPDNCADDRY